MHRTQFSPADVGSRATIRILLPNGNAQDHVGWIVAATPQFVTIEAASGVSTRIDTQDIIAFRRLPLARGGRSPAREPVERVIDALLPGIPRTVDGWSQLTDETCEAAWLAMTPDASTSADMLTSANSLLVIHESTLERALIDEGWRNVGDHTWDVHVCSINDVLSSAATNLPKVVLADVKVEPGIAQVDVLSAQNGKVLARGICRGDWVSIRLTSSDPIQGTAAIAALCRWSARRGARNAVTAVTSESGGASRTLRSLTFTLHHRQHRLSRTRPQTKP